VTGAAAGHAAGEGRLPLAQILSYSLPALGTSMILVSVAIYLPNYYTDELGVTAGMLSWVFLAGRVWDAVTDPLMGHVSDRTSTRWGRRRPYFLLSALPIWAVFYLIWSPSPAFSVNETFLHLIVCYLLLYTFWTVFSIPYLSLGMELTPAYHERTRLFGGRQAFYVAGTALGMLAPVIFANAASDKLAGYSMMGAIFGGLTVLLILIAFTNVKERPGLARTESFPFFQGLRVTFRNRAFVVLVLVYLFSLVGASFIAPLSLYMAKYVIKAEWVMQYVMLAWLAGSLGFIPLWLHLSRRIGKNRTWSIALIVAAVGYALSYTYHEGTWMRWIALAVVVGAAQGCTMTLGPAISADVIDSDELETGKRREGAFVGIWSFVDKAAIGLAVFVGLQGLDAIGYRPNVEQNANVIEGMKFLYCLLPAICHLVAVLIFQRFPITPEIHAQIRAELDARAAAERPDAEAAAPAASAARAEAEARA
jgi:GPH family glycoside/pentoside/hexuronide:cation symporter